MLSKQVSLDEKVNQLSNDTARLLFTWMIPHLDIEGRMYGEPIVFKSIVAPRRPYSTLKVEKYLTEMEKLGLIIRYSVNGNLYLFAPNFEKHQIGLRKDRESPSQIPPPPPDLLRSNDGIRPPQIKENKKYKLNNKSIYGQFSNVFLTDKESRQLTDKFGETGARERIEALSLYIKSKGDRYKDHYATILNWERRNDETHKKNPRAVRKPDEYTDPESLRHEIQYE